MPIIGTILELTEVVCKLVLGHQRIEAISRGTLVRFVPFTSAEGTIHLAKVAEIPANSVPERRFKVGGADRPDVRDRDRRWAPRSRRWHRLIAVDLRKFLNRAAPKAAIFHIGHSVIC